MAEQWHPERLVVRSKLFSDTPPTIQPLLGFPTIPGIPSIAWNGGGNATIQYDSCWISSVTQSFLIGCRQRELIY